MSSRLRVPHAENPLDKQIAATALMYGLTVVTRNVRHYEPTGVAVLNPFTLDWRTSVMSKNRCGLVARLFALSGILSVLSLSPPTVHAQQCDRACLTGMMTQFINALVAHDSSTLPLAANVRYTEDSRNARLGEGIWRSVTANGGFRQDYIDTRKQVAAAHVLLREGETQVLYSVLLHVANMKIAGIETLVQRVGAGGKVPAHGTGQADSRHE